MAQSQSPMFRLLVTYLKTQVPQVLLLTFLVFASIGLELLNPQILRQFIDRAKDGSPVPMLTAIACLYLGITLLHQVITVSSSYLGEKVAWTSTNALREDLVYHCLHLDLSFHNARTPGELLERVDGDVAQLANFLSGFAVRLMGDTILLFGVLAVLYLEQWQVGAALTVFTGIALTVLLSLRNIAVPYWVEARQATAELFGYLEEILSGTEDLRANGAVPFAMRRFYRFAGNRLRTGRIAAGKNVVLANAMTVVNVAGPLLALIVAYFLYRDGAITIGTVFLFVAYANTLFQPLNNLSKHVEDFQRATASVRRIYEFYHTRSNITDGLGALLPSGPFSVAFQNLSFFYDEMPVLEKLSFQLGAGRTLGLLGRTGSGKTTIARLLFRFYDPQEGAVLLDGHDIRQIPLADLRRRVGMVTQSPQLFSGTIRDNLTFFSSEIPDEQILDVIQKVGLGGWLQGQPQGLETLLETGGAGISAGEAQLLAFARVFFKAPSLVILDEPSSRLDPATESNLEKAVDLLLKDRTGIIIAHRLSTLERVDDILIIEDGEVREFGARKQLAADPHSHFSQLLRTGLSEVLT